MSNPQNLPPIPIDQNSLHMWSSSFGLVVYCIAIEYGPFTNDLPIRDGIFFQQTVSLPEGQMCAIFQVRYIQINRETTNQLFTSVFTAPEGREAAFESVKQSSPAVDEVDLVWSRPKVMPSGHQTDGFQL